MSEFIFKAGDKVKVPWSDEVYELEGNDHDAKFPLKLKGSNGCYTFDAFTKDGKVNLKHPKPILTLVERPKKKVQYWVVTSEYDGRLVACAEIYNSELNAKHFAKIYPNAQVHLIERDE